MINQTDLNFSRFRVRTILLTIICQMFQALFTAGLPLLMPLIRKDLDLTFTQIGILSSANILIYAFMQIPSGYLADRFSPRRLVFIGAMATTLLTIGLGLAQEFWHLLGIMMLMGFFSSFYFTPSLSLFMRWFPVERRSSAMGLAMIGMAVGFVIVNLVFPAAVEFTGNWRMPFIYFPLPGIIAAFLLLRIGKDPVYEKTLGRFNIREFLDFFRLKIIWVCGGLQFIRFAAVQGVGFWLPSLLVDDKAFPLQLAGILIALQSLFTAPGNVIGGMVSDRTGKPVWIISSVLVMMGLSVAGLIVFNNLWAVLAMIVIISIFQQMYFAPLMSVSIEKVGIAKAGLSNGINNTFANAGGLVMGYYMGSLRDATGSFYWGYLSVCGICAVGLILAYVLAKLRKKETLKPGIASFKV